MAKIKDPFDDFVDPLPTQHDIPAKLRGSNIPSYRYTLAAAIFVGRFRSLAGVDVSSATIKYLLDGARYIDMMNNRKRESAEIFPLNIKRRMKHKVSISKTLKVMGLRAVYPDRWTRPPLLIVPMGRGAISIKIGNRFNFVPVPGPYFMNIGHRDYYACCL